MIEDERESPGRFVPRNHVRTGRRSADVVCPPRRAAVVEAACETDAARHGAAQSGAPAADGGIDWSDLHAFQRDVLLAVAALEDSHPYGRQIKERLDEEYDEDVVESRLYQALDALADLGLVRKRRGTRDARTNYYSLTDDAGRLLAVHVQRCVGVVGLDVASRQVVDR